MATPYPGINFLCYSANFQAPNWQQTAVAVEPVTAQYGTGSPTAFATRVLAAANNQQVQHLFQNGIPYYKPLSTFSTTVWFKNETWSAPIVLELVSSDYGGVYIKFDPNNPSGFTCGVSISSGPAWSNPRGFFSALPNGWVSLTLEGVTSSAASNTLGVGLYSFVDFGLAHVGQSYQIGGMALYLGLNNQFINTQGSPSGTTLPMFNFPFHKVATRYPANSQSIQFGGSYVYTVGPNGPPQRTFALRFRAIRWYFNPDGSIDTTTDSGNNIGALEQFYQNVQTNKPFNYVHPIYGLVVVRFAKPLEIPETLDSSPNDVVGPVQLELIEEP